LLWSCARIIDATRISGTSIISTSSPRRRQIS